MTTAVVDTDKKTITLFDKGDFKFRPSNKIIDVDKLIAGDNYVVVGTQFNMVPVQSGYYSKEEYDQLCLNKDFEELEREMITLSKMTLKYPFYTKREVEMCYLESSAYAGQEHKQVTVSLPRSYAFVDYRTQEDNEVIEAEDK